MRENLRRKKVKEQEEEQCRRAENKLEMEYTEMMAKQNEERIDALRATKRKAEERTNLIIQTILRDKQKRE